jgi:MOSC domain-containing protein YiiM
LEGDSHAGTEKEISLLAEEDVQALCRGYNLTAEPGSFAENIRTEGIDLTVLPVGTTLLIGEAKLKVTQIGKDPSQSHTYSYRGHSLLPQKGIFGQVIKSGEVKVGDSVVITQPGTAGTKTGNQKILNSVRLKFPL